MGKEVKIEIMDTTLRDGEQTCGVSFVPHEKLMIARFLLEELHVDRIEVGSARVSDGEFKALVEKHGLTGLEFKLIWTEERGLEPMTYDSFTK